MFGEAMSEVVFEVVSKLSKKIALTTNGYEHISERHPEVSGEFEKIKETLVNPQQFGRVCMKTRSGCSIGYLVRHL